MEFKLEQFLKDRKTNRVYSGNNSRYIMSPSYIASVFKDTHKQHLTRYSGKQSNVIH